MNRPCKPEDARPERSPHVVLDRNSRIWKAKKIISIVGEDRFSRARRILEVGCGSGVIASTLAQLGSPLLEVHAVDVTDSRTEREGYSFQLVNGTSLPFADCEFDLVISNHVIEHVGQRPDQVAHLNELRRVLAPDGQVYLAVPNKWRVVEPHFRLPLLSWLPQAIGDAYVRATGKGSYYDCLPLSHREAGALFKDTGFSSLDKTIEALHATLEIEFPLSRIARVVRRALPASLVRCFMPIMPTYVFVLEPGR